MARKSSSQLDIGGIVALPFRITEAMLEDWERSMLLAASATMPMWAGCSVAALPFIPAGYLGNVHWRL